MKRVGIVVALLVVCACKPKPGEERAVSGSNVGSAVGSAAASVTTPPAIDAAAPAPVAAGPFVLPSGATTVAEHDARKADASALGAAVTVQFVDKLGEDNDGYRHVDEMLVLTGASAMIVEIADDSDASDAHKGVAPNTLSTNTPLSPPRPFGKEDATVAPNMLPFKGPLLYLRHGKGGEVAVAHVDDTIVVWKLIVTHGESEDVQDWFEEAKIKLAPGATVTAR